MGKKIVSLLLTISMLAGLLLGMPTTGAAAEDSSLMLWYRFNEGTGTTVADSSGNNRSGKLNGTYSWTKGPDGSGAISLDGSSGFVQMPNAILAGLSSVTVATNVFVDQANSNPSWVFTFGSSTNPNGDANAHYLGLLLEAGGYRAMLATARWTNEQSTKVSSDFVKGVWKHVAYTQTGTTGTLYVDGVQVARNTGVTFTPAQMESTIANYIGKPAYTADRFFKGKVSDFRLYSRALSASEVKDLANSSDLGSVAQDMAALTLGDTSEVISNLNLPSGGAFGSTITWSTSDASVITNTGVITSGAADKTATLTATIAKGAASATKTFTVTVKSSDVATTRFLQEEAAKLAVRDADAIRGNITLPLTSDKGAAITWTSDKPDVINANESVNENYDNTPPGVLTRQAVDTQVTLTATLSYSGKSYEKKIPVTVKAKPKALTPADMKEYLFSYFTGESSTGEQTYFATSKDGLHWKDLNDLNPVLTSDIGEKGVRDHFILRSAEGDKYYILATDLRIASGKGWTTAMHSGSTSLVIWESTDLVNWSAPRLVDVAGAIPGAGCAWAPEATYDEKTGEYVVYWATISQQPDSTWKAIVYYAKTRDFYTFTTPQKFIERPSHDIIDTTIIKADNSKYKYYRASGDGQITIEGSNQLLHSDWDVIGTLQSVGKTGSDVEGPEIYKFNDRDEFAIIADQFATGKGYLPVLTNDLSDPSTYHIPDASQYWFGVNKKRHGGLLSITQEEYDRIMAKWGDVPVTPNEQPQQNPILEYNFDENSTGGTIKDVSGNNYTGALNGNAKVVFDQEKNSQVLYLDGSSGTFAAFPQGFFDGRDAVTISMDVKPVTVSGSFFTFTIGKNTTKYMFLKTMDTQIRNAITMGSYSYEEEAKATTASIANKWMNIKLVMTPTTMTMYKDGVLFAQNNNLNVPISYLGKDVLAYLGKSFYSADAYFKGNFDNIKVYNRALTASEIAGEGGGAVTGVSLNKSASVLEVGKNDTLVATIVPSYASNKAVTFASNSAAVTLSNPVYDAQTGTTSVTITGASEGSAVITATTADGGKTAVCVVTVTTPKVEGLKLWYKFDEVSGSIAADSSGNGYNGAYVNTPAWGTGMSGGSFKMSGGASTSTTAPYVKIPNGVLNGTNNMTIASYVKWNSSATVNQWLYALGINSNKYIFTSPYNGSGLLYSAITNYKGTSSNYGYTTEEKLTASAGLTGNTWKHVALVIDSDNHTGTMYVDGIPVATNTNVTIKPSDLYDASKDYSGYIGKSFYSADPYFAGEIDDFRIYDRALSADQVADLAGPLLPTTSIIKATASGLKYDAIIDSATSKVTLALKPGGKIQSIAPEFTLSSGATISPASGSVQDLTNPITYTVTGKDGKTQKWTVAAVIANNPVLPGLYADPEVAVFGNKFYIYPTTDGYSGWAGTSFKAFSSDNLIDWKDEGIVFDLQTDENWDGAGKYAWAPAIAEKNGIYYFYYCANKSIGVATSTSPAGPFKDALGKALIKAGDYSGQMIDPAVFKDDDGQYYIYFGQAPGYVAKLNDDMISLNGKAQTLSISGDSFHEGEFMIKRNGIYYLMWSKNDTGSENYQVVYATGSSPTGPFTGKGIILQKDLSLGIRGTGHSSVIKIPDKDEYYIVYHRMAIPDGKDGYHREVCIDKLEFNADGTIKPVVPTLGGISTPVYLPGHGTVPTATLSGAATAYPGQSIDLTYRLSGVADSIYAHDITLAYDPDQLEFESVQPLREGLEVVRMSSQAQGKFRFLVADVSGGLMDANADLFKFVFKVKSQTLPGSVSVSPTDLLIANGAGVEQPVTGTSYSVSIVAPGVPGDVNSDGKVSVGDLGIIAAAYGKTSADPDWAKYRSADINHDGKVDIEDLAAVARLILG
ncbi:family 43 glycosylhydrolase [Paenibacillus planticolens]|uniref:family 43 glycosylhydrolase n=1 Tax=Paenibacillus planticolens TaxID=2654976 RepID=UPI0014909D1E|nr:family 43 glycosylhydrolase [Paenibacillus planticolens]